MAKDKVSITLEIEKIGKGLEEVKQEITALGEQVKSEGGKITTATAAMDKGFQSVTKAVSAVSIAMKAIPTVAAIEAFQRITGFATGIVETGLAFEKMQFQLRGVSDTIEEADRQFQMIRDFAYDTPHLTEDVTNAFIMLKAVGLAPTIDQMRTFGDAAFAMGRNIVDVSQAIIALETEVLRRLGVQIDRTGKQAIIKSGEMRFAVENDLDAIREKVIEVWERRFGGAMEKGAGTATVAIAEYHSAIAELQYTLSVLVLPTISDIVKKLTEVAKATKDATEKMREYAAEFKLAARIFEFFLNPGGAAAKLFKDLSFEGDKVRKTIEGIKKPVRDLKTAFDDTNEAMKQYIESSKRLGQAIADQLKAEELLRKDQEEYEQKRIKAIDEEFEKRRNLWQAQQAWIGDYILAQIELDEKTEEVINNMKTAWEDFNSTLQWSLEAGFFDLYKGEIDNFGDYFREFCQNLVDSFARAISKMISNWLLFGSITGEGKGTGGLAGWLSGLVSGLVTSFQFGGLLTEPVAGIGVSGRRYLFGEAGPEVVTPARDISMRGSDNISIYLVDDRAKTPVPSRDQIVLFVNENIQRDGVLRKTIKRFT